MASVTNLAVDNFDKHIEDTMIAGDWLSDPEAVKMVVTNAPSQINELIKWGVDFDKNENGDFDLHREGGHPNSVSCTTRTTREPKFRRALSRPCATTPTSTYSRITSPSR